MPAPSQSAARTSSRRNVLLLEEYDALAAAISSALKKFAPDHTTSVARSIADARHQADKFKPELLVLDVDPPWLGLTEFLEEMRKAHPQARVLVVGAAIPADISAIRGSFGALQFINKPFELAAFGAAVQAVLGPWREAESDAGRGTLQALTAIDVMLVHCAAGANVILEIAARKHSGMVHLADGEILHAQSGTSSGLEALQEILSWPNPHIKEVKPKSGARRTIHHNWEKVFVDALQEIKPAQAPRISPPDEPLPAKPRPKTGKKIVVVDDTEMLLIFVEDVLSTADPELQITTALTGTEGIKAIERIKPDLVLLDYSLPDLNGDRVCETLLRDDETARVPILMMSGHVLQMRKTAEQFENVVATIEKPFLSDSLVQLVRATLSAGTHVRRAETKAAPSPAEPTSAPKVEQKKEVQPAPVKAAPPAPVKAAPRAAVALAPAPPPQPATPPPAPIEPLPLAPKSTAPVVSPAPAAITAMPSSLNVVSGEAREAVLGLFLEVIAMQLTSQLQMGAIRAKPASLTVSLRLPSATRQAIGPDTGFQLGETQIDSNGRILSVRLIPTSQPFRPSQTRNAFEIGGVAVIPNDTRSRVQLTPAGTTPMTMQLIARMEISAVELSGTFQVSQLLLKWRPNAVRVTLSAKATEQNGAVFEPRGVKLDAAGRIAELFLNPVKPGSPT